MIRMVPDGFRWPGINEWPAYGHVDFIHGAQIERWVHGALIFVGALVTRVSYSTNDDEQASNHGENH